MIETDILIVGAGPAGLATAIALKRGAKQMGGDAAAPRVMVLDKGRRVGSHVLSGAIIDPPTDKIFVVIQIPPNNTAVFASRREQKCCRLCGVVCFWACGQLSRR